MSKEAISTERAMKLALEALDVLLTEPIAHKAADRAEYLLLQAAPAIRKALAEEPAQHEPVKHELQCICGCSWEIDADGNEELVFSPPAQRTWVGLTEQEAAECWSTSTVRTWQSIEAKLKEKNT